MKQRYPATHLGWHRYYVGRFNKSQHPDAEYLAMLYLNFHLALQEEEDRRIMELAELHDPYPN